jgi:ferredoxin
MKGLGLAGAGLGAAAAATPMFHDLDELASSGTHPNQKWWVKDRDFEDITTEVDWGVLQAIDKKKNRVAKPSEVSDKIARDGVALYQRGIDQNIPGLTLRDMALSWGARSCYPRFESFDFADASGNIGNAGAFPSKVTYSAWGGNPEDNLKMCRNIDKGFIDADGIRHVPNKCKWVLVFLVKQEAMQNLYSIGEMGEVLNDYATVTDPMKISNKSLGGASSSRAYAEGPCIQYRVMRFVKGLGHQAYQLPNAANVQFGIFSGTVEEGRSGQALSPDYGIFLRYHRYVVTDLPLAPTKPIDAGLVEFCKSCIRCGTVCPSGAISQEKDTTWEGTGPWPVNGGNNRIGFKGYYMDWQKCTDMGNPWNCTQCQSSCPFGNLDDALIHQVVRATAATTTLFNGFFATMADVLDYSRPRTVDTNSWWDRDLNSWKHDGLFGFGTAGW